MKALKIDRTGSLDDLTIRDVSEAPLGPHEVRVCVEAAGVNPSDVGILLGKFPQLKLPRVLGRDFAGNVVEGAPNLIDTAVWGTGGAELGLTRDGSHAETLVVPVSAVAPRPPHLSAQSAAAMGTPFLTAFSTLVDFARVEAGEWVIVSGAAGAVGTASVQIVKALNARPIALVLASDDVSELESIGVEAIVRSDRDNLATIVNSLTGGNGADGATNAVGAPIFSSLVDALGKDGRMVIFSAAAGHEARFDLFTFYRKHLIFYGFDSASFSLERTGEVLDRLAPYVASQKLRPPIVAEIYPLERAREAYERVSSGEPGKVVISPRL